jgi:hypothetical protein
VGIGRGSSGHEKLFYSFLQARQFGNTDLGLVVLRRIVLMGTSMDAEGFVEDMLIYFLLPASSNDNTTVDHTNKCER